METSTPSNARTASSPGGGGGASAPQGSGGADSDSDTTLNDYCNNVLATNRTNMVSAPSNIRVVPVGDLLVDLALRKVVTGSGPVALDMEGQTSVQVLKAYRTQKKAEGLKDGDITAILFENTILGARSVTDARRSLADDKTASYIEGMGVRFDAGAIGPMIGDGRYGEADAVSLMMRAADMCSTCCKRAREAIDSGEVQKVVALNEKGEAMRLTILTAQQLSHNTVLWEPSADGAVLLEDNLKHLRNPPTVITHIREPDGTPLSDPVCFLSLPQTGITRRRFTGEITVPRHQIMLLAAADEVGNVYAVVYDPTYAQFNAKAVLEKGRLLASQVAGYNPWAGAARAFFIQKLPMENIALERAEGDSAIGLLMKWVRSPASVDLTGFSLGHLRDYEIGFDIAKMKRAPSLAFRLGGLKTKENNDLVGEVKGEKKGRLKFYPRNKAAGVKLVKPENVFLAAPFSHLLVE